MPFRELVPCSTSSENSLDYAQGGAGKSINIKYSEIHAIVPPLAVLPGLVSGI